FAFRFFVRGVCHLSTPANGLALRRRRLLARDGLARALARARGGVRALAAHRQILAVALAALRAHVEMALDVGGHLAPEVAFDLVALLEHLANLGDLVVGEIVGLAVERDAGLAQNLPRRAPPDAVNVREPDFDPFALRQIHACNTRHLPLRNF